MEIKNKPHQRLTRQGWLATVSHSIFSFQSKAGSLGQSPSEAMKNLNEFLVELKR